MELNGDMAPAMVDIEARLRDCGLRPTRQRVALADLLFAKGDRHLTVEELHEEAGAAGVPVSLATVYNTLHQFTEAGLIRVLQIGNLPQAPEGMEIAHVDVIIRLREKKRS
jgi:Fur family transcriptional regulator, iron response regulator